MSIQKNLQVNAFVKMKLTLLKCDSIIWVFKFPEILFYDLMEFGIYDESGALLSNQIEPI